MFKTIRNISWKGFKYVFLPTLPLTFFPIVIGIINGVHFGIYHDRMIRENTDKFLYSVKSVANDWGVPGFTFRDFQDTKNDYHIMRINSNDWLKKLNLILPTEYTDWDNVDAPINQYADLEQLVADMVCPNAPPKEQWIYLARYRIFDKYTEWGQAFDKARQHAYAPSKLNESHIFLAECSGTADFLCGVWQIKAPALLHFKVEDEKIDHDDIPAGLSYRGDYTHLHPVTARVIEFPLENAYLELPPSVFPGYNEQLLSIMKKSELVEQFDEHNLFMQEMKRHQEAVNELYDAKASTLGVFVPLEKATALFSEYTGAPKRGDYILAQEDPNDPLGGWNPMSALFGGMSMAFKQVMEMAAKNASEQKAREAVTPFPTPP
ncbi:hypothetical protein EJ05DRAFT_690 [Pseudovirgaria hyperparasitica]|uniref:Uncharacterized protein n=1 Tax=Pseudovirgaria hyperparasitica TaxID=470096 RepID=A0A6A6WHY0_9PEZI|nr:uncharacterized protein EJ05DRAFT_690 [Pseudovirgaria hyperparasitica]KAF2762412.1 hypothetical protein EJ05DRAFT_690 [Pseudovirgaria hyperparasitica]